MLQLPGNCKHIEKEMLETAIEYWFKGNDHIRSPFPDYIKSELQTITVSKYMDWAGRLSPDAIKEINDEIVLEKFEEVLFEEAYKLVGHEDERLTIKYPFMIRTGDKVKQDGKPESIVISRAVEKVKDAAYMKVMLQEIATGRQWSTSFELPE